MLKHIIKWLYPLRNFDQLKRDAADSSHLFFEAAKQNDAQEAYLHASLIRALDDQSSANILRYGRVDGKPVVDRRRIPDDHVKLINMLIDAGRWLTASEWYSDRWHTIAEKANTKMAWRERSRFLHEYACALPAGSKQQTKFTSTETPETHTS